MSLRHGHEPAGCLMVRSSLPLSWCSWLGAGENDCRTLGSGTENAVAWVIGQRDPPGPQVSDHRRGVRAGGPVGLPRATADIVCRDAEEDGQGGQAGKDLVLADVGVPGPGGVRPGGAGVAVAAPVGGLAVGPAGFHVPLADPAAQQPHQQVAAARRAARAAAGLQVLDADEVSFANDRRGGPGGRR